eukprot:TRINITY_DN5542_c0_g1_i2.p1 TRINITY_DN5542_c0_g1~~TRINITY_DN5542_c0_g1_i2.p1  ORF type:complete len:910 (+),score=120.76 TRINITY_DN5542_c0_g1_i2:84-2732(+)
MAQRQGRSSRGTMLPEGNEEKERGFSSCWSGANAPPRKALAPVPKIRRNDVGLLRKSIEGQPRQPVQQDSQPSKWAKGDAVEFPEVPEDHDESIISVGERVRDLPVERKNMVLDLITSLESSNASDDDVSTALKQLIEEETIPMWLSSPQKTASGDDATLKIFSPVITKRPSSGRRARTPAGYSSGPTTYSRPGEYTLPSSKQTPRPSYEDPLDVLSATVRSAPVSRPVSPLPSPVPSPPPTPSEFCIPTMPSGRRLSVNCLTTWGDPHYLGLNGIEVYDETGELVKINKENVSGSPPSINILPEYNDDPRIVQNLVDGVPRTCDDSHVWLAPYTPGKDHTVTVDFGIDMNVSMLRFWNYNKSRPHSSRGVKEIEVTLDEKFIFKGEVSQASGMLQGAEDSTEIILFTMDQTILNRIDANIQRQSKDWATTDEVADSFIPEEVSRPSTSYGRPATRQTLATKPNNDPILNDLMGYPTGDTVTLEILKGWGDMLCVGVGSLQIIGTDEEPIPIDSISCSHACECTDWLKSKDTPDWYAKLGNTAEKSVVLTLTLSTRTTVKGVKIWNYNENLAATFRGVKRIRMAVDGKKVSPEKGFYVRKAPGHSRYDYAQRINVSENIDSLPATMHSSTMNKEIADAIHLAKIASKPFPKKVLDIIGLTPPMFPIGYVFRIEISSTQGDAHYVGLNGIQLWDVRGLPIPLRHENLQGVPRDVTVLKQNKADCRVLSNLVDSNNNTTDDGHIWLAPFSPGLTNLLYLVFEEPMAISRVTFWNYAKTPTRGAEQVTVYADDNFIFSGRLAPTPSPFDPARDNSQHMIFTNDPSVLNLNIIRSTPSTESSSGVVFYDSGKASDLDSMPQTSCGRPSTQATRPMRGIRAAGFQNA